jgi:hypothetical protein
MCLKINIPPLLRVPTITHSRACQTAVASYCSSLDNTGVCYILCTGMQINRTGLPFDNSVEFYSIVEVEYEKVTRSRDY